MSKETEVKAAEKAAAAKKNEPKVTIEEADALKAKAEAQAAEVADTDKEAFAEMQGKDVPPAYVDPAVDAAAKAEADKIQAEGQAQSEADRKYAADKEALRRQMAAEIAAEEAALKEQAEKDAKAAAADSSAKKQSAQKRYDAAPYDITVVYECDGPDTRTVDGESEVVTAKLRPSCTKGHWEEMPRWEKGARKGEPKHLNNARLIGFMEGGELVEL